ncbi:hypothetical protein [Hymenobacter glacialis]|uniref:Penicillin-binding C-terminal domain-containing protein n=1 Tax=Hymenobacter glacialis TaxID=1908236 RepID=A0A1G1SYZ3_9BACT|nr:hypothetical protein [Hymenobacter glacialis]OGX83839.1 hypothetical protein BEN48_03495 [Hymenobacter glacialis]
MVLAADGTVLHAYLNATQKWRMKTELAEPLDVRRHAVPALAPHLARRLVAQFPWQASIRSTLRRGPQAKAEYLLNRAEKQPPLLSCAAGSEVRQVFWYVNDRFLRAAAATGRVFISPPTGNVKISRADDHGRNVDIQLPVAEL